MSNEVVRVGYERKETVAEGEVRTARWLSRGTDFGVAGTRGAAMI